MPEKTFAIVLLDGPFDGECPLLQWPPPEALLYRGEPYMWADKEDSHGRPMFIHRPEVPHSMCRVYGEDE